MKTFLKAFFVDQDIETVWKLHSPEMQKKAIELEGSKEKIIERLKGVAKGEKGDEMRKVLKDKEKFDQFVERMLKEDEGDHFIKIDGKWYFNKM